MTRNTSCSAPPLSDAMVACLEDYLPGGSQAHGIADSEALAAKIRAALVHLEERLAVRSRELQSPEQFKALAAARLAAQSALSSLQLLEAGRAAHFTP